MFFSQDADLSPEWEAALLFRFRFGINHQIWGGRVVRPEHVQLSEAIGVYHLKWKNT